MLDGAELSGNEVAGHELERMRDGHRHSWWQAPGTVKQDIIIRAKNLITNENFELGVDGWPLYTSGSGAGTFAHNTSGPIDGAGDALLTATTADSSSNMVAAVHVKPIFLKADRTYRFMFRAMVQDASQKQIRFGFLKDDLSEDASFYSDVNAQTSSQGHYIDVAPTSDGWYLPYIRALEAQTLQFDCAVVGEVRDIDTLIIDAGHSLVLSTIDIDYSNTEQLSWVNVASPSETRWDNSGPVYITFTGVKSLVWRVSISVYPLYSAVDVAKVPLMYLGERWTMPHHFSGSFDPDERNRIDRLSKGDRGIAQRSIKYNQRVFRARMSHLSSNDYTDVEKFFEDTDNGSKPFFFAWQPSTKINDVLCMRLRGSRNVPYMNGALREWQFEAEELAGKREI